VTERLYYADPYLTEFDARVLECAPGETGRHTCVLDRTAFYPTSGGQPYDAGTLGNARVVDVVDREDGTIAHVIEGDLDLGPVRGRIDWERRFDHMQQHTGQHVLSAAFDRILEARTVSFHLGAQSSTIDLTKQVSPDDIARAESEANRIVWEDRPVSIRFADAEEAARLPLRKETGRQGRLRLIDVDGYDLSACGGTHVARTGAIGMIAAASWERFRGGTRVEFLCGGRALRGYRTLRASVADSIRLLSVLPAELPSAIERQQADVRESKRRVKELQTTLASFEAETLASRAANHGGVAVVADAMDGWDANGLKLIASHFVTRPGRLVLLVSSPEPTSVVVARSTDVSADASAILRHVIGRFGGKGGGRPGLAQGGGLSGAPADIAAFARSVMIDA
jgi:alanyl-tRNA synthetase